MKNPHLTDPRTQYFAEKFPDQEQNTPALQSKMNPKPDCGEQSYSGHNRLEGRNALITGGDSGMGRAAAIAYAREGANVAIQFFPGEEADANEVKDLIEKAGKKALLLPYDLREDGAATEIVTKTVEAFGGLDTLVLNAAQQIAQKTLSDLTIKQVQDTFKINIISMFETVKAAESHLQPGSAIVTTSSVQSYNPTIRPNRYSIMLLQKLPSQTLPKTYPHTLLVTVCVSMGLRLAQFGRRCNWITDN